MLALLAGRQDITGQDRRDEQDRGKPLAGKSTLNRLELTPVGADADSRYQKIVAHIEGLQDTLVDVFIRLRAKQSWSRERRVVGKAEHLAKGANPRFVVTSLSSERIEARQLYEEHYCQRGDMENRI